MAKIAKKVRRIRKDHKLLVRAREIEDQIRELCQEMSKEFGLCIGWSDAREIAAGMSISQLRKSQWSQ